MWGEGVAPGKMARVSARARVGARGGISAEKRFAAGRAPPLISYMLRHVALSPHTGRCGNMEEQGTIADKSEGQRETAPSDKEEWKEGKQGARDRTKRRGMETESRGGTKN